MKRVLIGVFFVFACIGAYFATFSASYKYWFPYYTADSITNYFFAGLLLILIAPLLIANLKILSLDSIGYFKAYLSVSCIVIAVCILTFLSMLSNSTSIRGIETKVFQVVPMEAKP